MDELMRVQETLIEELKHDLERVKRQNLRLKFELKKKHRALEEAREIAKIHRSPFVDPFAGPAPSQVFPWERT